MTAYSRREQSSSARPSRFQVRILRARLAAIFTEVLGQEVRYNSVSPETYRGFGFPGADDLGNMFQFKRDFEDYYSGARNPNFARSLNPIKMWLTQNKNAIPLEDTAASA